MKKKLSFTLIELIVASVILGIGVSFLSGVYVTGKIIIKQAQNKAIAMSIANLELDRWMAMSYEGLEDPPVTAITNGIRRSEHGKDFVWRVNVIAQTLGVVPPDVRIVPYQNITVSVNYQEDTLLFNTTINKEVMFSGYVAYPFVHIDTYEVTQPYGIGGGAEIPGGDAAVGDGSEWKCINDPTTAPFSCNVWDSTGAFLSNSLAVEVSYLTNKIVVVGYNIALDNDPLTMGTVGALDTIRTRVGVEQIDPDTKLTIANLGRFPTVTETPIISQPVINNRTQLEPLVLQAGNTYKIFVEWQKRRPDGTVPQGAIFVTRANIIVEALEE